MSLGVALAWRGGMERCREGMIRHDCHGGEMTNYCVGVLDVNLIKGVPATKSFYRK